METHHTLFIDGRGVDTAEREPVIEPYSQRVMGTVARGGAAEAELATSAAVKAFTEFRRTPARVRLGLLKASHAHLKHDAAAFAELIAREAGKPITQAKAEVDRALMTFELAAAALLQAKGEVLPLDFDARTENYGCAVTRVPVGPVLGITPFNFPLNLLAHKVAPALAAGCTLVVKAPPQAPLTALRLATLLHEAGVPAGVVNVIHVPVPVAETMVRDARFKALSFTGSARVGWHLKSVAGKKRVLLELGGNAGVAVHDDADLEWAVQRIVAGAFAYAGQVCISVQRVFVQKRIYETFVARLVERTRALVSGDPLDPATVCGPVIDRGAHARIRMWIEEARVRGAQVLTGGGGEFPFVEPTILAGADPSLKVCCEEVFGPVLTVAPYGDWEEALDQINASPYGLQAGVFTRDMGRVAQAHRGLEVGAVIVNDAPTLRVDNYPYGGVKDSGFGREGISSAIEELTEPKALILRTT